MPVRTRRSVAQDASPKSEIGCPHSAICLSALLAKASRYSLESDGEEHDEEGDRTCEGGSLDSEHVRYVISNR